MHTAKGQFRSPESRQIGVRAEGDRSLLVVDGQKLLQIEDLDTMSWLFAAYYDVVFVSSDLPPATWRYTGGLGKTTEVTKLSSGGDL